MIPIEVATLRDILLGLVTNSEDQALKWTHEIIDRLDGEGFAIRRLKLREDEAFPE